MGVYSNLGLNFDTSKFGDALQLSADSQSSLTDISNNTQFSDWQISGLAKGVNRTDYYVNPTTSVVNSIVTNVQALQTVCNGVIFTSDTGNAIVLACANTLSEAGPFLSHTNNVSGISANTASQYSPTLDIAQGLGSQVTMILNKTEGVANAVGALGMLTSLYIVDDLTSNNNIVYTSIALVNNSITTTVTIVDYETVTTLTSNLTSAQCNTIYTAVQTIATEMNTRRTGDWTFYQNSLKLVRDYTFLQRFSNPSNTTTSIINNTIGTSYLKQNIGT
jgi:hypothetical protein